jgi:predicted dehydrogenase
MFADFEFVACADLHSQAAEARARIFGIRALSPSALLADRDIDIVLNLTVPAAHAEVSSAAIAAGKHVFTEKPLATSLGDARALVGAAERAGLKIGSAPDTVLGAGVQTSRAIIDRGDLGEIVTGTAAVVSHGMEDWHPNPGFFFQPGAGPVLDVGPYPIAALVYLLGPVRRVQAAGRIGSGQRLVTAEGPMKGQMVKVETLTTVNALLSFSGDAEIVLLASWDVWNHGLLPIELHGTTGSLRVPDPDYFGGRVELATGPSSWDGIDTSGEPFGQPNYPHSAPREANYRGLGLAEMAASLTRRSPQRCNGRFALHCLEIMLAMIQSAESSCPIEIESQCERPPVLSAPEARALLKR